MRVKIKPLWNPDFNFQQKLKPIYNRSQRANHKKKNNIPKPKNYNELKQKWMKIKMKLMKRWRKQWIAIMRLKSEFHLAGTTLDDDVTAFADGAGLLRIGLGGSGIGLWLEVVLLVRHDSTQVNSPIRLRDCETRWRGDWGRRKPSPNRFIYIKSNIFFIFSLHFWIKSNLNFLFLFVFILFFIFL